MAKVQNASAGKNLYWSSAKGDAHEGEQTKQANLHLNQEPLELAPDRVDPFDIFPRNQCPDVAHHVSEGGVEYQSVDRFMEGLGDRKGDNNKYTSQQ